LEPAAKALKMREVQAGGALADRRLLGQEGEERGQGAGSALSDENCGSSGLPASGP
jgi:hypothetical protein